MNKFYRHIGYASSVKGKVTQKTCWLIYNIFYHSNFLLKYPILDVSASCSGTLKCFFWSRAHKIYIIFFLKVEYFQLWFLLNWLSSVSTLETMGKFSELNLFKLENDDIFLIIYRIKVSKVPLWIDQVPFKSVSVLWICKESL